MKHQVGIFAISLASLLLFAGCRSKPQESPTATETKPEPKPLGETIGGILVDVLKDPDVKKAVTTFVAEIAKDEAVKRAMEELAVTVASGASKEAAENLANVYRQDLDKIEAMWKDGKLTAEQYKRELDKKEQEFKKNAEKLITEAERIKRESMTL